MGNNSLRITASEDKYSKINDILGVKSNVPKEHGWIYKILDKDNGDTYFIDFFLSVLDGKYDQLKKIGIQRDDISIWMLYEYDNQCNMEFLPGHLYKMGEAGIGLCISCWEKG